MEVNEAIEKFRALVESSWNSVSLFSEGFEHEQEEFFGNWLQANWELLVEGHLLSPGEFLEIYGQGADLGGASSRASIPDALPTHQIVCSTTKSTTNRMSGLSISLENRKFDSLVSWDRGWHSIAPPLDHVLIEEESESDPIVIKLSSVRFRLLEI